MHAWLYVRGALVLVALVSGMVSTHASGVDTGLPLWQIAFAVFVFGVVGMLFVIGIQAFNPRSASLWGYPSWSRNPFTMREPLQFFHFGGFFFLAAGLGALVRAVFMRSGLSFEPVVFACWGAGILVGVWLCTVVFRRKMVGA